MVDFWESEIGGETSSLYYMLKWRDLKHREEAWGAFVSDPGMDPGQSRDRKGRSNRREYPQHVAALERHPVAQTLTRRFLPDESAPDEKHWRHTFGSAGQPEAGRATLAGHSVNLTRTGEGAVAHQESGFGAYPHEGTTSRCRRLAHVKLDFGFVSICLSERECSPAGNVTVKQVQGSIPRRASTGSCAVAKRNLENTLRIMWFLRAHDLGLYRISANLIPLATRRNDAGLGLVGGGKSLSRSAQRSAGSPQSMDTGSARTCPSCAV